MSPLVAIWTEDDAVRELPIRDGSEAESLFVELCLRLRGHPSMVEFAMAAGGCALAIGAGRTETVVTYQSSLDPPYFISAGDPARQGHIEFEYAAETTPYGASSAIPVADGRRALAEYLTGGKLPTSIDWERL